MMEYGLHIKYDGIEPSIASYLCKLELTRENIITGSSISEEHGYDLFSLLDSDIPNKEQIFTDILKALKGHKRINYTPKLKEKLSKDNSCFNLGVYNRSENREIGFYGEFARDVIDGANYDSFIPEDDCLPIRSEDTLVGNDHVLSRSIHGCQEFYIPSHYADQITTGTMMADILDKVDELGDRATQSSVLGIIKTIQSKYRT